MAGNSGGFMDLPFIQPGRHHPAAGLHYLAGGELPLPVEEPASQQTESYGDPQRQLMLRQAPMHARVAIGKEKDRKPIDPPPIVQLLDKRHNGKSGLYDSPYLFMTSSLVPETYGESSPDKEQELPTNYLVGSLVSSIHRLRDTDNVEGGFFVFGDLSVKREGRFRLRFTLFERDQHSSSFYFVSELITNAFTVYSTKLFPGMADSTQLTRTFSNQGVKVRLRKDSSGMAARKRNRGVTDVTDDFLDRQTKRSSYDRELPLANYAVSDLGHLDGAGGLHQHHGSVVVGSAPPPPPPPPLPPPPPSSGHYLMAGTEVLPSPSSSSRNSGLGMPLPTGGYYFTGAQYF
ncbi:hypothetical protein CP533_4734 [Ophiocordyceps camponoti-saundersi (nom. inval.)]|nr:hypothetical protein CP533_4734 [Ophiocordyceps camponoti-saundersi (nom. inval.)]